MNRDDSAPETDFGVRPSPEKHIRVRDKDGSFFWACARTLQREHVGDRPGAIQVRCMSHADWQVERRIHRVIEEMYAALEESLAKRNRRLAGKLGGNFSTRRRQLQPRTGDGELT